MENGCQEGVVAVESVVAARSGVPQEIVGVEELGEKYPNLCLLSGFLLVSQVLAKPG